MSYQALARKYRPQQFDDVVGQETTVRTLQNAIEANRIHHAYLFSGVRGVGKTTAARILAKALNCQKGPATEPCNECVACSEITEGIDMDVREIDAATYTGVDNIRELRDVTQFQPARDRYRVFIIDEAHMLSTAAWNALLKILEEPPSHVVFMFATTEIQKVPPTILSRMQKFPLRKLTLEELIERLARIAKSEGIEINRAALEIIARRGEGSVRDALSILDQIIAFSGRSITPLEVTTVLGLADTSLFARLVSMIAEGDHAGILDALQEAADGGRDFKLLYRDLLHFLRSLLILAGGGRETSLGISPEDLAAMQPLTESLSYEELLRITNLLLRDDDVITKTEHQRLGVEIALLKAATLPRLRSVEDVLKGSNVAAAAPRKTPEASRSARAVRPQAAGDISAFTERLQKVRPLIASYLSHATSVRKEGDRIIAAFTDAYYADSLRDARPTVEETAREVYGSPVTLDVELETGSDKVRGSQPATTSPLREDPVIKAFAKHLGGEIVEPRKP